MLGSVVVWVNNALRRFVHIEAISRQKEARSWNYTLLLFWMAWKVLHSVQPAS